jgi:probable DNA metabolism protein
MRTVVIEASFESWREVARKMLGRRVPPDGILWSDGTRESPLFGEDDPGEPIPSEAMPKVPPAFVEMARAAAAHGDPRRWALLYRLLWRLTRGGERTLLLLPTDPDVRQVQQWVKAVRRDIHKMHAFVRFRLVGTDEASRREQFVAWFEPEYRIVRLASPFFGRRFVGMDWSILTPHECAHWDGSTLFYTPGVARSAAPDDDALEELWRTYYRSIFNPARLKVDAMRSEMPEKYWKNLPEAPLIPGLIAGSRSRVREMLETEGRPVKPAPRNAYLDSLRRMNGAAGEERGELP